MLPLAYHECKNLTHMSKTHQVKCTQMVATGRFMVRTLFHFSNCYESNASRNETVVRKHMRFKLKPSAKVFTMWGFTSAHGGLTFWKFDKISTGCNVSYFNLEGILVVTGVFYTSLMLSLLKIVQNATITESSKTEQRTVNS